ncbi:MAG: ABC transporter substrate-binding protein [Tissierellaceae bacterium]
MKRLLLIVVAALLLLGIAGCSAKEASTDGNTKIVISEMRGESWIPVYAAEMLGYFEEEGLDTEWVVFKDGPIAFQGMHAGDSQFCMLSTEPVLRAYEEGLESKIIISTVKNKQYLFATDTEIQDVKELKGKAIFAGMPGSAPYSFVLSILEEAGMSENDVEWINLEYGAALVALEQGSIAGSFFDGIHINELKKINANVLVDTTDPATHELLYGSKFYESQMVTVTKEYAEKNPETIQKFVNAVIRAMKWQETHTEEELAELVSPMFEGRDLLETVKILKGTLSNDGLISEEGYGAIENFCLDQGLIGETIGYENIIDMTYVNKAIESIGK